jgi:hypothetical protein
MASEAEGKAAVKEAEALVHAKEGQNFDLLSAILAKKAAIDGEFGAKMEATVSDPAYKPLVEHAKQEVELATKVGIERKTQAEAAFGQANAAA